MSERVQSFLSWAALSGFIALVWFAAVMPALDWSQLQKDELSKTEFEIDRVQNSILKLSQELSDVDQQTEFTDLWVATNVSEATAKVQASLGELSRKSGISLRSITPLESPDLPLYASVAFRLEAEATLDRFVEFTRDLEFSSPLLIVRKGSIRRLNRAEQVSEQPAVFFQLDIATSVILAEDGS